MLFNGMRKLAFVSSVALAALTSPAIAGEAWRVVDTAGAVKVGGAGVMPVSLNRDQPLPADSWVQTGVGGRAVLARGQETIVVEPNSRVQLPDEEVNGNTQVLQTLGSALYKIGKQKKPHFQVDTPYLAAVVKGTEFTVSVDEGRASVMVTEGLVEVATPGGQDAEFVPPGFTAVVSGEHKGDVVVGQTPRNDNAETNPAREQSRPTPDESAERHDGKPEQVGDNGTSSVLIPVAVGEVEVNIKEVSGGLAFGEMKTAAVEAGGSVVDKTDNSKRDGSIEADAAKADGGSVSLAPSLGPSDAGTAPAETDSGNGKGIGHNDSVGGIGTSPVLDVGAPPPVLGDVGAGNGNGGGNGNAGGSNGNAGGNGNGSGRGGKPVT
ncbi:MAG: FecR domain-containing protein [Alphaproteobacteria bacterium]|nr:FecR domain-containing protein [Alphaproteobacteria bacterium]